MIMYRPIRPGITLLETLAAVTLVAACAAATWPILRGILTPPLPGTHRPALDVLQHAAATMMRDSSLLPDQRLPRPGEIVRIHHSSAMPLLNIDVLHSPSMHHAWIRFSDGEHHVIRWVPLDIDALRRIIPQ